jgi:hypothetical protein
MIKFDLFCKRVLVVSAGASMILFSIAMFPNNAVADPGKIPVQDASNTIYMGTENGYAYYLYMPAGGGKWSFEKIPLSKAKPASW